uniref:Uncharacterized protein n=1 Tax=Candidatus Kentrum sp. MB TaxID=2138164 RepID=A0A450X9S0_9GAMM|nr:MAG: hypothetical protein BECKMB1821G_GA0114241_10188 [Candidatus Kentron sp. MB]
MRVVFPHSAPFGPFSLMRGFMMRWEYRRQARMKYDEERLFRAAILL